MSHLGSSTDLGSPLRHVRSTLRSRHRGASGVARRSAGLGFLAGVSVFCIAWGAASDGGTWRIVERKSKWWMPSPGRYSLAGSEMPVAFGQHPLLKTVSGVSAIACPYRGSNNRRRQILGYAI